MPIKTDHYLLDSFLDGDVYSSLLDSRRFNTVDNQLNSVGDIIGDGRIDGWTIVEDSYPLIRITAGSGIVDHFYVNTYADQIFELSDNGTFYFFVQRKVDVIGGNGPKSDLVSVSYTDVTPPATPALTAVAVDGYTVQLTWTPNSEQDFSHYELSRSTDGVIFDFISSFSESVVYNDATADELTTYTYRIRAYDLSGNYSEGTDVVITPESQLAPPDPSSLLIIPAEYGINVLWKPPLGYGNQIIDHYVISCQRLYPDNSDIAGDVQTATTNGLYVRFDGLLSGDKYRIVLQAVNDKGWSSVGISGTTVVASLPSAPPDPVNIEYSDESGLPNSVTVDLSWTDGSSVYDPVLTYGYKIYITVDGEQESLPISVAGGFTSERISIIPFSSLWKSIPEDKIVTIRITALGPGGTNAAESLGTCIRFRTRRFTAPEMLQGINASFDAYTNRITVGWTVKPDTEDIRLVIATKTIGSVSPFVDIYDEYIGKADSFVYQSVTPGLSYQFTAYACTLTGVCGDAAWTTVNIDSDLIISTLPTPILVPISVSEGDRQLILRWENDDDFVAGFKIYRKSGDISFTASDWTLIDTLPATTHIFPNYGLENDIQYSYYMTSVDIYGRESKHLIDLEYNLNFVTATPKMQTIIREPYDVSIDPYVPGLGVHITWYGTLEPWDSFTVYRSVNNLYSWQAIGSVARGLNQGPYDYTDNDLPLINGTTYYYVIDKVSNDAEIKKFTTYDQPDNSIYLGKVVTTSDVDSIDQSDVRDIKDLRAPMQELVAAAILLHHHSEITDNDPTRIDLRQNLVVTDWTTTDGKIWTTEENISGGAVYVVKVNNRFPSVFFRVNADAGQIVFAQPIATIGSDGLITGTSPKIELWVSQVSEVDNVLDAFRIQELHARQIGYGSIQKEQIPTINHNGRIKEDLEPNSYLLERYDAHTFILPEGTTNSAKNFGTGTAYYSVYTGDGAIETVADFEGFDDGVESVFRKPSIASDTSSNILTNDLSEVNSDPGGFQSAKSCHIRLQFVDNDESRWVRITTGDTANKPNPTIRLDKRVRFKVLLTQGSFYLALGIREISGDGDVGSDGGTTGSIEWVGIQETLVSGDHLIPRGMLITASDEWQEIDFNLRNSRVVSYSNGDGILANGYGVIEHLAIAVNPDDPDSSDLLDFYIDTIEQVDDLIVAGTSQGIQVSYDLGSSWQIVRLTSTPVHKLYHSNGLVWAVTCTEVFLATDPLFWFNTSGLTGVANIRDITEDNAGNLYVSTDKGVYWFDFSLLRSYPVWKQTSPVTAFSTDCYAIYHDSNTDEVFVSTELGIFGTTDNGITWTDTGLNTSGRPAYQIEFYSGALFALTSKQVLHKLPADLDFSVVADLEILGSTRLWTFEFFNGSLYLSAEDAVYKSTNSDLLDTELTFTRTLSDLNFNGKYGTVFGFDVLDMQERGTLLFIGQENRLSALSNLGKLSTVIERSGTSPLFFVNEEPITNGYVYNSFNNTVIFRESVNPVDTASASYLPISAYQAINGGWAQTNPFAEFFIYKDGIPVWIFFSFDNDRTLQSITLLQSRLQNMPDLDDFNSLQPLANTLKTKVQSEVDSLINLLTPSETTTLSEEQILSNINSSIVELMSDLSQLIASVNADVISASSLTIPGIYFSGQAEASAGSRAETLSSVETFTSCEGIVVNVATGFFDFSSNLETYVFSKHDHYSLTVFNAILSNIGDFTHRDLEDRMEDRNTGLSSGLAAVYYDDMIKTGIWMEKNHAGVFDRPDIGLVQAKFSTAISEDWYDQLNSTVDYATVVFTESEPNIRFVNATYLFEDTEYTTKIWLATDNGIAQIYLDIEDVSMSLNDIITPDSTYPYVRDIYAVSDDEIYIIVWNAYGDSKIMLTEDEGVSWDSLNTSNLPNRIYNIRIISGNVVVGTENGLYYSDDNFDGWYAPDFTGSDADKSVFSSGDVFNLCQSVFLIGEVNQMLVRSSQGVAYSSPGTLAVECINKIVRFKNFTYIGTDQGLYNDGNTILSESAAFAIETLETSSQNDIPINDIVAGENAVYAASGTGKIYRYANHPSYGSFSQWLGFQVPSFSPIHKMILVESTKHILIAISYDQIKAIDVTPTGEFDDTGEGLFRIPEV